jgi:hypothetical protein
VPQSGQDHIRDPFRLGAGEGVQAAADVQVHRAGQHLGEEVGVDRGQFTALNRRDVFAPLSYERSYGPMR